MIPSELLRAIPPTPAAPLLPLVTLASGGTERALFDYLFTKTLSTNLR